MKNINKGKTYIYTTRQYRRVTYEKRCKSKIKRATMVKTNRNVDGSFVYIFAYMKYIHNHLSMPLCHVKGTHPPFQNSEENKL